MHLTPHEPYILHKRIKRTTVSILTIFWIHEAALVSAASGNGASGSGGKWAARVGASGASGRTPVPKHQSFPIENGLQKSKLSALPGEGAP